VTRATEEFQQLVAGPEDDIGLDVGCLLIAAHAHPADKVDDVVAGGLAALDRLADGCPGATPLSIRAHLFDDLGFSGNRERYDDPRNSYLDVVIAERTGIPITLSVVTIEVARRLGVGLTAVGMPGHFLVGLDGDAWLDAFDGGRVLDLHACRYRFGSVPDWDDSMLAPVGARAVLARVLANLRHVFTASGSLADLVWVLDLRTAIPGVPVTERAELASVLTTLGRYGEAGTELERLADLFAAAGNKPAEDDLRNRAIQTRARLN
jgi:regulator of sirC expression with transglutaminase-like and TPR domain